MIMLSYLNDFYFCPYSIYLHSVYSNVMPDLYYDAYQVEGRIAHDTVDTGRYMASDPSILTSFHVFSDKYHLYGIVDIFKITQGILIERKKRISRIFKGQIYQVWGQYFCLREMGFDVNCLSFHELSTNKDFVINIPTEDDEVKFQEYLDEIINYDPLNSLETNIDKCSCCIYAALCDKRL